MRTRAIASLAVLGLVFTASVASARAAYFNGEDVAVTQQPIAGDAFLAGNSVSVTSPVHGELFAASNNVTVTERPDRSIFAAGNSVTIEKGSGYNAFAAGSTVTLDGDYAHDVYVAGSTVILKPGTVIHGDLRVGGGNVVLAGKVDGSVWSYASTTDSNAVIGGAFNGQGDLTFTGGSIGGDLKYKSHSDAKGLDKVKVLGSTSRTDLPKDNAGSSRDVTGIAVLYDMLSVLILGGFLILVLPRSAVAVREAVNKSWTQEFGRGAVLLFVIPLLAIVFLLTIIGAKLAGLMLALFVAALLMAKAFGVMIIGEQIARQLKLRRDSLWIHLALGVVVVAFFKALPNIGTAVSFLVFFGATVPALGATFTWWKERHAAA